MVSSVQLIENALLLQQTQEKASEQKTQNLLAIAPHVLAAIHAHNGMLLSSTVHATAPHASIGAGAPKSSVGDDPFNPFNGGGYVDQLAMDIENVYNNPNDPTAVAALVNYLGKLTPDQIRDPQVQSMLAQFNMSSNGPTMINELVEYAYFMEGGKAGAQALITQLQSIFGSGSQDPSIAAIQNQLQNWNSNLLTQFDIVHDPNQDGVLVWGIPNPNGDGSSITLTWNGKYPSDNFAILQIIGNQLTNGLNPYSNGLGQGWLQTFLSQYRSNAMADIWGKSHNLGLLIMYLMMLYDGDSQSQQGGLANTTNLLSDLTNKYANQLLTDAQSVGTMTSDAAAEFAHLLLVSTAVVGMESQTSGMTSDWTNNVLNPILNLQCTGGTVGDLITKYLENPNDPTALANLTTGLNSLNGANGSSPGPQPGFQSVINALQSGSGLLTGTSKTVSTQLSLVTNLETQLIKLGNSNATSDGGGWMQMINAILNNQISH